MKIHWTSNWTTKVEHDFYLTRFYYGQTILNIDIVKYRYILPSSCFLLLNTEKQFVALLKNCYLTKHFIPVIPNYFSQLCCMSQNLIFHLNEAGIKNVKVFALWEVIQFSLVKNAGFQLCIRDDDDDDDDDNDNDDMIPCTEKTWTTIINKEVRAEWCGGSVCFATPHMTGQSLVQRYNYGQP
jgi:hypothetical protein